jgi:hypothetical protein
MNLMLSRFIKYCEQKNIKLLAGDIAYIKSILMLLPSYLHRGVLKGYIETWLESTGECDNEAQKMNFARRNANLWLGDEAERLLRKLDG